MPTGSESVLVVTTDEATKRAFKGWLADEGLDVLEADCAEEALALHAEHGCALTISDAELPECDGIELMQRIRDRDSDANVALVADTSVTDISRAALDAGAIDFLSKPVAQPRVRELTELLAERQRRRRSRAEHTLPTATAESLVAGRDLPPVLVRGCDFSDLVVHSEAMRRVVELAAQVAMLDCPALISGPQGAGKEVLARTIHKNSYRRSAPFEAINCAAMPDGLLEAELFGMHSRTEGNANVVRSGMIARCDGGTLVLDEICALPASLQRRVLEFVEEGTVTPVGAHESSTYDVRIFASTEKRIEEQVRAGAFMPELYDRLAVFPLHVPPLAERVDDVIPLAQFFLRQLEADMGRSAPAISREAVHYLTTRIWAGNVRELRNAIERAVITSRGSLLTSSDFRALDAGAPVADARAAESSAASSLWTLPPEGIDIEALNRSLTEQALERTSYKVSPAARLLGMSRATLRYRIRKYGFDTQRGRKSR